MAAMASRRQRESRHRRARIAAIGLALAGACLAGLAAIEPAPVRNPAAPPVAQANAAPAANAGTFTGTYQDALPVYAFPPIVVTGRRSSQ